MSFIIIDLIAYSCFQRDVTNVDGKRKKNPYG